MPADAASKLSVGDAKAAAGTPLVFKVKLKPPSDSVVKVRYRTADGSARAATDYAGRTGTLKFKPGARSRKVRVPTIAGQGLGSETMTLILFKARGAKLKRRAATGTIVGGTPLSCPANASGDVYVQPNAVRPAGVTPTGVAAPGYCSFATVTAAIASVNARALDPARIVIAGAGSDTAVLSSEQYPLTLPQGTTLTTAQDPALGGPGLDPADYVIRFGGSAPRAMVLQDSAAVRGITLQSVRQSDAAEMVACSGGAVELSRLVLDGLSSAGKKVQTGLVLQGDCDLTMQGTGVDGVRVRNFGGPGVSVGTGAGLETHFAWIYGNGGAGIVLNGASSILDTQIALNATAGIVSDSPSVFLANNIRDNRGPGLIFHSPPAPDSFHGNLVHNNARWAEDQWDHAQIAVDGPGSYDLSGGDPDSPVPCSDPGTNRIYSYNNFPVGPQYIGKGLAVFAPDTGTNPVDATVNYWRYGVEGSQNLFVAPGAGPVDDSGVCGGLSTIDKWPADPID